MKGSQRVSRLAAVIEEASHLVNRSFEKVKIDICKVSPRLSYCTLNLGVGEIATV